MGKNYTMNSARKTKQRLKQTTLGKPRNPLVAPMLQRKAGAHAASWKSKRQAEQTSLRKELRGV